MIPTATIPTNVKIKGSFRTFLRIMVSGSDKPITDIIKAKAVPNEAPFSIRTETIGITPAALEYNGTPTNTDNGTLYQTDLPINEAINSAGT